MDFTFPTDGGPLTKRLNEARAVMDGQVEWDGGPRPGSGDGSPPARELRAAIGIAYGLLETLQEIDPTNRRGYQEPVRALWMALCDLIQGNNPPDWIKPPQVQDRSEDGAYLWETRLIVATVLQRMIHSGVARVDAQRTIFGVLQKHGVPAKSETAAYSWLKHLRSPRGLAPDGQRANYRDNLAALKEAPKPVDLEKYVADLLNYLATALEARGYLALR